MTANLPYFLLNSDLSRERAQDPELDALMTATGVKGLQNTAALVTRIFRPDAPDAVVSNDDVLALARSLIRYSRGATLEFRDDPQALADSFADYQLMLRRIARLD